MNYTSYRTEELFECSYIHEEYEALCPQFYELEFLFLNYLFSKAMCTFLNGILRVGKMTQCFVPCIYGLKMFLSGGDFYRCLIGIIISLV